ncbi:hypothetical protein B5C26_21795 [Photorhabdus luminescens]|uniref:hypothetical protein n=1 Tax=Photorhabdus luminescens TaxID=29488 RepID=UPI000B4D8883|nr:hypothetical protein [Photorhabdus luminescens]OWO79202.1 hypothetical protein B5C26_21795 [Photorhabdus luminescens]
MNQNNDPSLNIDTGGNTIKQYWQPNRSSHADNNTPIASTRGATAMLLPNGRVIAWGNNNEGNDGQKVGWGSTDDNKLHYEYDY